jgi:ribose transport system permease protein
MVSLLIIAGIVTYFSVWGLEVRAVGSDKESAACTEVNVGRVHRSVFTISGGMSALAGVMVSLILNSGAATVGTGWELIVIAGCAIGGISLFGYEGSFFGLFCGLLVLQMIQNGIVIVGISVYTQNVVIGIILLIAMTLEIRRRRWLNIEQL